MSAVIQSGALDALEGALVGQVLEQVNTLGQRLVPALGEQRVFLAMLVGGAGSNADGLRRQGDVAGLAEGVEERLFQRLIENGNMAHTAKGMGHVPKNAH